jgi:cytochrome P450
VTFISSAPLNLLDPFLYAGDPDPSYRWLRDEAPVCWDPANRIWGISRHRDVLSIERDTSRYSSASGSRPLIEMSASMINRDDPRHQQQRRLVSRRFSPRAVRRHEEHVRAIVTGLIDAVAAKGEAEVVADLAAPLPAMIIGELLGFDRGPVLNMRRTVTVDHELHGQDLRQGDQVLLMYAAANRDDREFDGPDRFDVTRRHNHHVAFGFGTHLCLGANLARLELRVLFEELLRRLPDIRLTGCAPEFAPGYFTRTLKELRVEFSPAG